MAKDFNTDTLLKFLSQVREHRNTKCPYFEDEAVRLVHDIVSHLNDPQLLPKYMLRLKIARRRFS